MNRLEHEASLYLRQHAANPVDWYPWGEEAFRRAEREDRPILLSVGYSSCHWCHVMAHECFEDEQLAALQNRLFVSVKVDREERPDVDRVYMEALQALTGSGGWPMTVFLLPDGRPFFAGTYFPKEDRQGLPGFGRVMEAVERTYRQGREQAERLAGELTEALRSSTPPPAPGRLTSAEDLVKGATATLLRSLDPAHGGFGGAPKFPQAPLLEFLLARAAIARDAEALGAVELTLAKMAEGGVRDQLGGGFHRYSVDERWAVPHFEKMLYDQAQLISTYLHLWQLSKRQEALQVARSTADFVLRDLRLAHGGLAASLDADTASGEGLTYVWEQEELERLAEPGEQDLLPSLFRLDPRARVEGGLVLQGAAPFGEPDLSPGNQQRAAALRRRLLLKRSERPQPGRDEKVVVSWNALAASALAELGVADREPRYLEAAELVGRLLRDRCTGLSGELHHLFDGTEARGAATLEDLAAAGLLGLSLHEAAGDPSWFSFALELAERADRLHRQAGAALWFDVAADHDRRLAVRPMSVEDGATRSGISLMAELCLRLSALTGDRDWEDRAGAAVGALLPAMERVPAAFPGLLTVALLQQEGLSELALLAPGGAGLHRALLGRARARLRPNLVVGVGQVEAGRGEAAAGPPLVLGRPLVHGAATAYVCRGFACRRPTADPEEMEAELGDGRRA